MRWRYCVSLRPGSRAEAGTASAASASHAAILLKGSTIIVTRDGPRMIRGYSELQISPFLLPADRHRREAVFRQSRQFHVASMMELASRWINRPAPKRQWKA